MAKSVIKQIEEVKARLAKSGFTEIRSSRRDLKYEKKVGEVEFYVNVSKNFGTDMNFFHAFIQGTRFQTQTLGIHNAATAMEALNEVLSKKDGEVTVAQITGIA